MRVMIFGNPASGKSTFAKKLANKLKIPVIHLDNIMEKIGRNNKDEVNNFIKQKIKNKKWIMDGNAFSDDKDNRIKQADYVIVFKTSPFVTLLRHLQRYFKLKFNSQNRVGSKDLRLNLPYFIPYIFIRFPRRRENATRLADKLNKKVLIITSYSQANRILASFPDKSS